jgi:hypothetical protein
MKTLLLLAAMAATMGTAAAQSPRSNDRSHTANASSPSPTTVTPNYSTAGKGQKRPAGAMNTHPATGPTRASRSSSTLKSAKQGSGTGTHNTETTRKNSMRKPGTGTGGAQ